MHCPSCHADDTRVIDSRPAEQHTAIRRRRRCDACGHRFTTYERPVPVLMVRKRNGRVEAFSADKLRAGMGAALVNRPIPGDRLDEMVELVEARAQDVGSPVESDWIGHQVLDLLKRTDEVAYVRYASVYKEFQAAQDFERELAAFEEEVSRSE